MSGAHWSPDLPLLHQPHFALDHRHFDRGQALASARPREAVAILDAEEGAVGGAEDMKLGQVEETPFDPVQRPAGMGTGIAIGDQSRPVADDEEFASFDGEALAAGIGDVLQPAERGAVKRLRTQALVSPMARMSCHSSALTGTTDSRP